MLGRADYVRNSYRVLLTRARQGMVIFVPRGDAADATRPPVDYDAIDAWLAACGVPQLKQAQPPTISPSAPNSAATSSVLL
ncbi:MAG: DNA/RNA helicase domain-containing protein [Polymorphobacter sp.]